ncbi:MAG: FAD-binding oxidoreductase [bacterium]|nr:FAD-binding oxidoreductase [bacterium]
MIRSQQFEEKKKILIENLQSRQDGEPIALQKSTTNLFRFRQQGENTARIDVRAFNKVISIDAEKLTADVEGMTTYEDLVLETLKHGLMPAVVPELKSITIGGAAAGIGIEATSFKYGLAHETITELEILLSSGEVVICAPDNENSDLFFGFANSYGTLGYALRCRVKLIPVKKYLKIKHLFYNNTEKYYQDLAKFCAEKRHDFIDGVIFGEKEMYINLASFTDSAPAVADYKYLNIYYHSIKDKKDDYLTTSDYIWRWDTDWFWCSRHFGLENKILRLFWGKRNLSSKFYMKLRRLSHKYGIQERLSFSKSQREAIIQDIEIPIQHCSDFISFFHSEIGIKPVWVCPIQVYDKKAVFSLYPMNSEILYVNFGFWDSIPTDKEDGYYNRLIEKKVQELRGRKSLYSDSYYDEEIFWQIYNKPVYDKLKQKYDPQGRLLNLYEKCVKRK